METEREKTKLPLALFLMMILLAANMRACYTGVGTIISFIQADLAMNSTLAGLITTIPLLIFAFVCPLASAVSARCGIGKMLAYALVLIGIGVVLRAFFGAAGLFGGTVILSVGVGIMNALMVGLIKLRFPAHTGLVTSAYTTTMALTNALALAVNVPAAKVFGWRGCLAMWAAITVVTLALWLPQAGRAENSGAAVQGEEGAMKKLLRSREAWILSGFMGAQSLLFYSITAWLPTILHARGLSIERAAATATTLQTLSLPTTLLVPILAERISLRKLLNFCNGCYLLGALLFYFTPVESAWLYVCTVLLGIGLGSGFSGCIFLFSARTRSSAQTAAISGFAQSSGYVLAAVGPVLMGALYDLSGSWDGPMLFCFVMLLLMTFCAWRSAVDTPIL